MKATVDAYNGEVMLYAWDDEDPILKTWQKIFPGTIEPISEMSDELIEPRALPGRPVQGAARDPRTYHVTDAETFYSGDDAWATPNDPTAAGERREAAAAVLPDDAGARNGRAGVHALLDLHPEGAATEPTTQSVLPGRRRRRGCNRR